MKLIIQLAALLSTIPSPVFAGSTNFYDNDGSYLGSSMPAGQNTFYYDGHGNNIGSAMKAGKNTFYYDAQGNNVGSSTSSGLNDE
jgi:YD repeat-containing protein